MPRTGGSRYAARLRPISPAVAARFARYATRFSIPWLAAADRRVRRRGQTGLPNLLVLAVMCYTYGMADSPEQQGRNQLPAGRRSDLGAHLDRVGGGAGGAGAGGRGGGGRGGPGCRGSLSATASRSTRSAATWTSPTTPA